MCTFCTFNFFNGKVILIYMKLQYVCNMYISVLILYKSSQHLCTFTSDSITENRLEKQYSTYIYIHFILQILEELLLNKLFPTISTEHKPCWYICMYIHIYKCCVCKVCSSIRNILINCSPVETQSSVFRLHRWFQLTGSISEDSLYYLVNLTITMYLNFILITANIIL